MCSYLGFVVGGSLVKLEPSKVQAVLNFPIPTDKTGVRAFLGLTGYYRRFIPNFASLRDGNDVGRSVSALLHIPCTVLTHITCTHAFFLAWVLHVCHHLTNG